MLIQMLLNFVLAWPEINSKADVFVVILSENRTCLLWTEWHCLLTSVMLLLFEKGANIKGKWNCVMVQRSGLANCVNMMHCLFKEFLIYKHTRLNPGTIEGRAIILNWLYQNQRLAQPILIPYNFSLQEETWIDFLFSQLNSSISQNRCWEECV